MKNYVGTCHCGAVEFSVETDLADPVWCNCSFCVRRGALLQRVSAEHFALVKGEERLSQYGNRDFSDHFFCKTCGIHTFTKSTRTGFDSVVVSLRCLHDLDTESIEPRLFDGATQL